MNNDITQVLKNQIKSLVNDNCPFKISYAMLMFQENGFDLYGGDHDTEHARFCTMKHDKSNVIVKLEARQYIGTNVILIDDPLNITEQIR